MIGLENYPNDNGNYSQSNNQQASLNNISLSSNQQPPVSLPPLQTISPNFINVDDEMIPEGRIEGRSQIENTSNAKSKEIKKKFYSRYKTSELTINQIIEKIKNETKKMSNHLLEKNVNVFNILLEGYSLNRFLFQ